MSLAFIILSLVITTLLVSYLTLKTLNLKSFFKGLGIDPEKKITDQPIFWLFITYPTVVALNLAIPLWIKYDLEFNAEAYTRFIDISALPLGFVLCAMYLVHVLIRVHSSSQTAQQLQNQSLQIDNQKSQIGMQREQLKNQRDQVQLKNYLDFKEYIIKKIEAIETGSSYEITDKHSFFRSLFPDFTPLKCDLGELNSKPVFIFDLQMQIYQITRKYLKDMEYKRGKIGPENWDVYHDSPMVMSKRIEAQDNIIISTCNYLGSLQTFLNRKGVVINSEFRLCNTNKGRSNTNIVSFKHDRSYFRIIDQHEYIIDFLERISSICILDSSDIKRGNEMSFVLNEIDRLSDRFEDCCQILNDYISNEKGELIFGNNTKQPSQPE